MRLNIKTHPNKILKTVCNPIVEIKQSHIKWANAMHYYMKEFGGVGLAAPQVGNPIRLVVINTMDNKGSGIKRTMINPEIVKESDDKSIGQEGCLSYPLKFINVERPYEVTVKYTSIEGKNIEEGFTGFNSRVVCHEIDHLNGITFDTKEVISEI